MAIQRKHIHDLGYVPGRESRRWNGLAQADFFLSPESEYVADIPPGNGYGFKISGTTDSSGNPEWNPRFPDARQGTDVNTGEVVDSPALIGRTITQSDEDLMPGLEAIVKIFNGQLVQRGAARSYYIKKDAIGDDILWASVLCYPFVWGKGGDPGELNQIVERGTSVVTLRLNTMENQFPPFPNLSEGLSDPILKRWPLSRFWLYQLPSNWPAAQNDVGFPPWPIYVSIESSKFFKLAGSKYDAIRDNYLTGFGGSVQIMDYDWNLQVRNKEDQVFLKSHSLEG